MKTRIFPSSEGNVWKYVFTDDKTVIEAVLYKYEDFYKRTVICCSVMSGCPVGCTFCGTGKQFIRNLTADEIIAQILYILQEKKMPDLDKTCHNFQIMFMSMGEPLLNMDAVYEAVTRLHLMYPNAQLLISTMGPNEKAENYNKLFKLGTNIPKVGLQLSIHKAFDEDRDILIPYKNKLSLSVLSVLGKMFHSDTGRKVYINYCIDGTNNTFKDYLSLTYYFTKEVFTFTFSVVCSPDETAKDAGYHNFKVIQDFRQLFIDAGYETKVFDPAGQDDIGGGCGQLWYVQQWLKERKLND